MMVCWRCVVVDVVGSLSLFVCRFVVNLMIAVFGVDYWCFVFVFGTVASCLFEGLV